MANANEFRTDIKSFSVGGFTLIIPIVRNVFDVSYRRQTIVHHHMAR